MSTAPANVSLTQQEALARQLIVQRVSARHHAPRETRRHIRAALLLRSPWSAAPRRSPHGDS